MTVDPITLEVLRNALSAVVEQMGVVLKRSSYSPNIKEREDCSSAVFDRNGRLVVQAEYPFQPGHLGAIITSVESSLAKFPPHTLVEGDVIMVNDPYEGGNHLPDIALITPVFFSGELVAFTVNRAHHADIGGAVPGSVAGSSTEIYQEGFIVPPVKLYAAGELNTALQEVFLANMRTKKERLGDLRAQLAANAKGVERLRDLFARHGKEVMETVFSGLMDYSRQRMTAVIDELPDGTYSFDDVLDDDGISPDPVPISCDITIQGSRLTVDFSRSAQQTKGPLNCPLSVTRGAVYYAVRAVLDPSIPANEGCYRPLEVVAPEGSLLNPKPPAPVVGGNLETAQRLADVVIGALSHVVPDRVIAASNGQMCNVTIGGIDPRNDEPYTYYETIGGGHGARATKDGVDGIHCHMTNTMNTPVEALELAYPFVVTRYQLLADTGGPGKFRGGLGIRRDYLVLDDDASFGILAERRKTAPYGLFGGREGARGRDELLVPDDCEGDGAGETGEAGNAGEAREAVPLPGKVTLTVNSGSRVIIRTPGGGGYGEPLERSAERVLHDVLEGRITTEHALEAYGVVVKDGKVDIQATEKERQDRRAQQ